MTTHEYGPDKEQNSQLGEHLDLQNVTEELAKAHVEQAGENERQDQDIEAMRRRVAFLEGELTKESGLKAALSSRLAQLEGQVDTLQQQVAKGGSETQGQAAPETEHSAESKSDTQRDLERLAKITGRSVDDPEIIKLNLRLKVEQLNRLGEAYDAQEGSGRQIGFMQDAATAKRELEEAMYLYDQKFEEMNDKGSRIKAQLERTQDPEARRRLMDELRRLKDHGNTEGHGTPRRDRADQLTDRLGDISSSLDGSEILATYELHQGEYPADPISGRRRTDTVDWRGKPEYDENGVYIGHPFSVGETLKLEPKAPLEKSLPKIEDTTSDGGSPEQDPGSGDPDPNPKDPEDPKSPDPKPEGVETETPEPPESKPGRELELYTGGNMEIPPIDSGDYPELYARRKNLSGGDIEALDREAERLRDDISANIQARINNFTAENPGATLEQIQQFAMQCYVESQNEIQQDVIAAIDGQGYENANGEVRGRSPLRRFGAWMDKHGSKVKKGMFVVGAAGAIVLTGGVIAGAIAPAFAVGAGTAIGAVKGALVGLGMSRHGSKESASRNIDLTTGRYENMFAEMDPNSVTDYARIADHLMLQYNASADKDHETNIKKSRRAAVIGASIGAIAGSISFNSPVEVRTMETTGDPIVVPNTPPEIPHHVIQPGELTGQVINNTLQDMGIDGSDFVNPDGSTNLDALHDIIPRSEWDQFQVDLRGTHSVAGADNLSNDGIRKVIEAIVSSHDWGSHTVEPLEIPRVTTEMVGNPLATITGWVSGAALAAAASRYGADLVKPESKPESAAVDSGSTEGGNDRPPREGDTDRAPGIEKESAQDWERDVNTRLRAGDAPTLIQVEQYMRDGLVSKQSTDGGVLQIKLTKAGMEKFNLE